MRKRVTKYGGTPLKSALIWQEDEEFKARNATVKFKANLWATLFAKKKKKCEAGKGWEEAPPDQGKKQLQKARGALVSVLLVC